MSDKGKASKSSYARAARKQAKHEDLATRRYEEKQNDRWRGTPYSQKKGGGSNESSR